MFQKCLVFCILALLQKVSSENRYDFLFLPRSGECFYMALSLPLNYPPNKAYLAYVFEADYAFFNNDTSSVYPPIISRKSRQLLYNSIESKIALHGFSGSECLLRAICEAGTYSINNINGIFGDILHILLQPSTSHDDVLSKYKVAEHDGKISQSCTKYREKCSTSFLDLISIIIT